MLKNKIKPILAMGMAFLVVLVVQQKALILKTAANVQANIRKSFSSIFTFTKRSYSTPPFPTRSLPLPVYPTGRPIPTVNLSFSNRPTTKPSTTSSVTPTLAPQVVSSQQISKGVFLQKTANSSVDQIVITDDAVFKTKEVDNNGQKSTILYIEE